MVAVGLCVAVLAATGGREVSVVLPGLTTSGLDAAVAAGLVDRFASELGRGGGLKVITHTDVEQLLGLERQRQLLGCADGASSCMVELTAALGADVLVVGSLLKAGRGWTATLRVLNAKTGQVLSSESTRVDTVDALQDWLDERAVAARAKILGAYDAPGVSATGGAGLPRWLPWAVAGAGGAMAVSGGVLFGASKADAAALRDVAPGSDLPVEAVRQRGEARQNAGLALIGSGVAVLAAGVAWGLLRGPEGAAISVTPAYGPGVVVTGTFP